MRLMPFGTCASLVAAVLLAGCGAEPEVPSGNQTAVVTKAKPLSQVDPQAYQRDPSTAMRQVPETMRANVQKAIVCRVNRQKQEGTVASLDAETIRKITQTINSGGSVEDACRL